MQLVPPKKTWDIPENSDAGKIETWLCDQIQEIERQRQQFGCNAPESKVMAKHSSQLIRLARLNCKEFRGSQTSNLGEWYELAKSLATGFVTFRVELQDSGCYLLKFYDDITRHYCAEILLSEMFGNFTVLGAQFFPECPPDIPE